MLADAYVVASDRNGRPLDKDIDIEASIRNSRTGQVINLFASELVIQGEWVPFQLSEFPATVYDALRAFGEKVARYGSRRFEADQVLQDVYTVELHIFSTDAYNRQWG